MAHCAECYPDLNWVFEVSDFGDGFDIVIVVALDLIPVELREMGPVDLDVKPVSPFGKVVKVVRTAPEPKKRPRRESFTDEPALFSQPDVLHKEHEPLAAPVPAPSAAAPVTTAGPTPAVAATPTTPKPAFPSDEHTWHASLAGWSTVSCRPPRRYLLQLCRSLRW
ncbi:hypothetical protein HPB49_009572 [Dermacentor silvarum]|uniref:Uncharacterized protein n=1 Tax=Dermacentor silvarum TaxID=543639 RepID=A0ACB8CWE3_DERSI|nr:hypothetical protein HPB49_009572 [Dermacentor silvarum]